MIRVILYGTNIAMDKCAVQIQTHFTLNVNASDWTLVQKGKVMLVFGIILRPLVTQVSFKYSPPNWDNWLFIDADTIHRRNATVHKQTQLFERCHNHLLLRLRLPLLVSLFLVFVWMRWQTAAMPHLSWAILSTCSLPHVFKLLVFPSSRLRKQDDN